MLHNLEIPIRGNHIYSESCKVCHWSVNIERKNKVMWHYTETHSTCLNYWGVCMVVVSGCIRLKGWPYSQLIKNWTYRALWDVLGHENVTLVTHHWHCPVLPKPHLGFTLRFFLLHPSLCLSLLCLVLSAALSSLYLFALSALFIVSIGWQLRVGTFQSNCNKEGAETDGRSLWTWRPKAGGWGRKHDQQHHPVTGSHPAHKVLNISCACIQYVCVSMNKNKKERKTLMIRTV